MLVIGLKTLQQRQYKNAGQHAEQVVRYSLTGKFCKADNKPYWLGGDVGSLQVKTAKATICKGESLKKHYENDKATMYGYVVKDFTKMYVMSRKEYAAFVKAFGYITKESAKNGGAVKIRLKDESHKMREWLEARA